MGKRFACPCCGYLTLPEEPIGTYNICPVCFWEDDEVQNNDPTFRGGANRVSLVEARENFNAFGVSERRFLKNVRPPRPEEIPS